MNAIYRMTLMEMKLVFRDPQSMIWTFIFPFVMVYFLGYLFGGNHIQNVNYESILVPTMIALSLTSTSLFNIGTVIASYKENKLLRTYQATPLGAFRMITAFSIKGLILVICSVIVAYLSGTLIYGFKAPMHIAGFIGAFVLALLAMFPLGIFLTGFGSTTQAAAGISVLALNLQTFLSGGMIPYQLMPTPLKILAKILPLHYVNDLFTAEWTGQSVNSLWLDFGVLAVMAVVFTYLAVRFFRWS